MSGLYRRIEKLERAFGVTEDGPRVGICWLPDNGRDPDLPSVEQQLAEGRALIVYRPHERPPWMPPETADLERDADPPAS